MNHCEGCGEPIRMVRGETGWLPVKLRPGPRGNVVVEGDRGRVLDQVEARELRAEGCRLYELHFSSSCSRPRRGRGRRAAAEGQLTIGAAAC